MLFFARVLGIVAILAGTRRAVAFDSWFVDLIDDSITVLFPPVRVSAHLCRVDQDGAIELSRRMSRKGLVHDIHREFQGFELRTRHDGWDHRILYVVDLDCDYAIPLLRAANSSGQFSAPMRWLLLRDGTIAGNSMAHVDQTFRNMAVYPDSEVIVATKLRVEDNLAEITSVYRPSPYHGVITENRGNWTMDGGVRAANLHAASRRRRNLRQTPLKSCLVHRLSRDQHLGISTGERVVDRPHRDAATTRDRYRRHGNVSYSTAYRCNRLCTTLYPHQSEIHFPRAFAVDREQHFHAAVSTIRLDSDRRFSSAGTWLALLFLQMGISSGSIGEKRCILAAISSRRTNAQ
ncbi:uncharacterized protein LOC100646629 isoform X1 [Bombus terrestris]|uniref:Uncharacterized protein LOC100646629 isoform X1 n=1 Tax=Bombus terrestris TaxID=30195 RepID=A0A9C6SC80_BOMTE|nr:uncharacterized protein LOC100646629 isoform X1 [Bombus terrestris]